MSTQRCIVYGPGSSADAEHRDDDSAPVVAIRALARGADTAALLHRRGLAWAGDLAAATREVHALYRIREWGED